MARRIMILCGVVVLLLGASTATLAQETEEASPQDEAIVAAKTAAKEWLALLDGREWGGTWKEAGELLRAAVSQDEWTRKMSVTLGPLGGVNSRAVRSSRYSTTLPGAPDGEYVVIEYDTSFANKQTAVETAVLRKETDGTWRISGYHIR